MPKVITFDRGSKRRLKQIRWKLFEVFTLTVLALFLLAGSILIMFWEVKHEHPHSEPPKSPQIRGAEPKEP